MGVDQAGRRISIWSPSIATYQLGSRPMERSTSIRSGLRMAANRLQLVGLPKSPSLRSLSEARRRHSERGTAACDAGQESNDRSDWSRDGSCCIRLSFGATTGHRHLGFPVEWRPKSPSRSFRRRSKKETLNSRQTVAGSPTQSNETGQFEIYLQQFPGPGGRQADLNRWRRAGAMASRRQRTVLYRAGRPAHGGSDPVRADGQASNVGTPAPLFAYARRGRGAVRSRQTTVYGLVRWAALPDEHRSENANPSPIDGHPQLEAATADLERLQERDQRLLFLRRQPQSELMSFHGSRLHAVALEAGGHVVVAQPVADRTSLRVSRPSRCVRTARDTRRL